MRLKQSRYARGRKIGQGGLGHEKQSRQMREKILFENRRFTNKAKNVVDVDGKIRRREFECAVHHVVERVRRTQRPRTVVVGVRERRRTREADQFY